MNKEVDTPKLVVNLLREDVLSQLKILFNEWAKNKEDWMEKQSREHFGKVEKNLEIREKDLADRIRHYHEIEAGMKTLTKAMKLIEKLLKK